MSSLDIDAIVNGAFEDYYNTVRASGKHARSSVFKIKPCYLVLHVLLTMHGYECILSVMLTYLILVPAGGLACMYTRSECTAIVSCGSCCNVGEA